MTVRKFSAYVLGVCMLGAATLIGMSLYSDSIRQDQPLRFYDHSRAVAVGVHDPGAFDGIRLASESPRFTFEVHSDLHWTIGFILPVLVPDRETANRLPPLVVMMPKSVSGCTPGQMVEFAPDGTSREVGGYNSRITALNHTEFNTVFEVEASPNIWGMKDPQTGIQSARYEIFCDTVALNTSKAGIGRTNFELMYMPTAAEEYGLVPGLPNLSGFHFAYNRFDHVDHEPSDAMLYPNELDPTPTSSTAEDHHFWRIPEARQPLSVRGTAGEKVYADLEGMKGWLVGALAAGFIGAIIGVLVLPKGTDER